MKKRILQMLIASFLVGFSVVSCNNDDSNTNTEEEHVHEHDIEKNCVLPKFDKKTRINQEDLEFGELAKGVNGESIQVSTIVGRFQDEVFHGTFFKIPKGEATIPHTHSEDYHAIVIKGIVENPVEGDEEVIEVKPGGFWYQPAGEEHTTKCSDSSGEDCLVYLYQAKGFDFVPKTAK